MKGCRLCTAALGIPLPGWARFQPAKLHFHTRPAHLLSGSRDRTENTETKKQTKRGKRTRAAAHPWELQSLFLSWGSRVGDGEGVNLLSLPGPDLGTKLSVVYLCVLLSVSECLSPSLCHWCISRYPGSTLYTERAGSLQSSPSSPGPPPKTRNVQHFCEVWPFHKTRSPQRKSTKVVQGRQKGSHYLGIKC